ncbi:hypothetical protein F5884DRAFT_814251 [Xylogone sp. PMI_703]|nr:hypothetical protein F5884DRAFT_814251 [Xylogone sp. PMI_703]
MEHGPYSTRLLYGSPRAGRPNPHQIAAGSSPTHLWLQPQPLSALLTSYLYQAVPSLPDVLSTITCPNAIFVLCRPCQGIVGSRGQSALAKHLFEKHDISRALYNSWLAPESAPPDLLEAIQQSRHLRPACPPSGGEPLPNLPLIAGFQCINCSPSAPYHTPNQRSMRQHLNRRHGLTLPTSGDSLGHYTRVVIQSWFNVYGRPPDSWWRVAHPSGSPPSTSSPPPDGTLPFPPPVADVPSDDELTALDLLTESHLSGTQRLEDRNPFLALSGWPDRFKVFPQWAATRRLTYLPRTNRPCTLPDLDPASDLLGSEQWTDDDELVLESLLLSFQQAYERCLSTLDTTPLAFRSWLLTATRHIPFPKEFGRLRTKSTEDKYVGNWKRLLACLFRARSLVAEEQLLDVLRYLTVRDRQQLEEAWLLAARLHDEAAGLRERDDCWNYPGADCGLPPSKALEEMLMGLSWSLVARQSEAWSESIDNLFIHFSGILSLRYTPASHTTQRRIGHCQGFAPIAQATGHLAGFVWISRLFVLEYALPQSPYRYLEWPGRETYPDPLARLHAVRCKVLLKDSTSVFAQTLRLQILGRTTRNYKVATTLVNWSDDFSQFRVEGKQAQTLQVAQFQAWVGQCVADAQGLLDELLGGYSLAELPPLASIQDSFSEEAPGLSFLTLPANRPRLEPCTVAFGRAVLARLKKGPKPARNLPQFFSLHDRFLSALLLVTQLTGGQPCRGPELLSCKVYNTQHSTRNFFVHWGRFCTLIQYNKAHGQLETPFYVARFLPLTVSLMLYQYLVCVRPLANHLRAKYHHKRAEQPQYLWATGSSRLDKEPQPTASETPANSDQVDSRSSTTSLQASGFWPTEALTNVMKESSIRHGLPIVFSTQIYRQVAIALTKTLIIPRVYQSDRQHRVLREYTDPESEFCHRLFAWQAGHGLLEHTKVYGLNGAYPTTMQPELLKLYHKVSAAWHAWLELEPPSEKDTITQPVLLADLPATGPLSAQDSTAIRRRPPDESAAACPPSAGLSLGDKLSLARDLPSRKRPKEATDLLQPAPQSKKSRRDIQGSAQSVISLPIPRTASRIAVDSGDDYLPDSPVGRGNIHDDDPLPSQRLARGQPVRTRTARQQSGDYMLPNLARLQCPSPGHSWPVALPSPSEPSLPRPLPVAVRPTKRRPAVVGQLALTPPPSSDPPTMSDGPGPDRWEPVAGRCSTAEQPLQDLQEVPPSSPPQAWAGQLFDPGSPILRTPVARPILASLYAPGQPQTMDEEATDDEVIVVEMPASRYTLPLTALARRQPANFEIIISSLPSHRRRMYAKW